MRSCRSRRPDPNPAREDLEPAERVELLTNRCFIHCRKQHANRWPYDDTYTESGDAR